MCSQYGFPDPGPSHMHRRFMPRLLRLAGGVGPGTRVLDVGCGNGFTCGAFVERGCAVVGVDPSREGIEQARSAQPGARFENLMAEGDLLEALGEPPFDLVISTEVVEHVYAPREWARCCHAALKPGGRLICSTPYHGYAKNLALSLMGKWDSHANPLWDGGHIKLWSRRTITQLLHEVGFERIEFQGVGRFPFLWMTMLLSATKPMG